MTLRFEWDVQKSATNLAKHGLAFDEVLAVFLDVNRIERHDGRQNYGEDRYVTIGLVEGFEIAVAYTIRDDSIRIISARKATRHEQEDYWQNP